MFRSLGLPESTFLYDIFTSFRVTVYVTSNNPLFSSRFQLKSTHFLNENLSKNIIVLDRLGQFGATFKPLEDLAMAGMSGKFGFTPFFSQGYFGLDFVSAPGVSRALAQLSSKPSLHKLLTICKEFNMKSQEPLDERNSIDKLVNALSYLERINAIGFNCNNRCDLDFSVDSFTEFVGVLRCAFPKLLLQNLLLLGGTWLEIGEFRESYFKFVADSISRDINHILYTPSRSLIEKVDSNVVSYEMTEGIPLDRLAINIPPINVLLIDRNFSFSRSWMDKIKHAISNGCMLICAYEHCYESSLVVEISRIMTVRTIMPVAFSSCSLKMKLFVLEIINNPFIDKISDAISNNFVQKKLMLELGLEASLLDESVELHCTKPALTILVEPGENENKSTELNKKLQNLMGALGVNIEKLELYLGLQNKNASNEQTPEKVSQDFDIESSVGGGSFGDVENAELASFVSESRQIKLPGKLCSAMDLQLSFRKPACISA
jgi:hypothetical protein